MIGAAARGRGIDTPMLMNQIVAVTIFEFGKAVEIETLLDHLGKIPVRVGQLVGRKPGRGLTLHVRIPHACR